MYILRMSFYVLTFYLSTFYWWHHIAENFAAILQSSITPFNGNVPLLYPSKMSENVWFFDVFRRYRCVTLVRNGLSYHTESKSEHKSSHLEVFCKTVFLKNFTKYIGEHLRQNLLFNKGAGLSKVFKNNFFIGDLRWLLAAI